MKSASIWLAVRISALSLSVSAGALSPPQDLKLDPAIIQQQDVAAAYVVDQLRVVEADPRLIARWVAERRIEDERGAGGQGDAPCGKAGNTDFWALQVGQDPDVESHPGGGRADQAGSGNMLFTTAMREVQAKHIGASHHQSFHHVGR